MAVDAESVFKPEQETITYTREKPHKAGRKALSDTVPREVVINDLSEEEKICPCCREASETQFPRSGFLRSPMM